jgi:hypothetical protein
VKPDKQYIESLIPSDGGRMAPGIGRTALASVSGLVLWSRGRGARRIVLSRVSLALLALLGLGFAAAG